MQITEEKRRERLIGWLEQIYREVEQQAINEFLFWELQKIVKENDRFRETSGLFMRWIVDGFKDSAVAAVRRQIKLSKESISLRGFLEEIKKYPELVSRKHYLSLYDARDKNLLGMGNRSFDRIAGAGADYTPVTLVQQQIDEFSASAASVEEYADRRIAHFDKREPAQPLPTFDDLTAAIKVQERLVVHYYHLLKGVHVARLLPTILFDWQDVFRFPWKHEG